MKLIKEQRGIKMSRYSRSSDDGIEDRRFHKKRRLLHDVSSNNESLCQFKKANANWNEVLDKSDRRIFSGEMRKFSFGGADISRSSNSLRQNNYSESHIATPGSSFFCNSDGDSECISSSFKTHPKFHKRDTVLLEDFKTALSRDVTLAQDPSFGTGLESNKSCFIADNSGNFATDNSLDNTCDRRGMRLKYRRHKSKQHSPKERKDFENILNDVTTSEYQSRIVPSSTEDNENEITNVDLNEVSHFKSNETGYGAPSAITYSTQIVTQTGQFGGMSYVTISEVKERVIIPGRSCPRPMKKGRREGTASEVNYNDNVDNGLGNASIKSTNSIAEMSIHEEGVAGNHSEILSDFEVESDVLNRSGPRPQYYSPLKHSRQVKQRKTKRVISKDVYAEFYEDDSIFNSDLNIASPLSIAEMDDSNTYNSTLRSQKAMQNKRNARHSRTKNESYGSSFNDVSGRSNSRRSILREISQNEFELRLVEDDIHCNDHEVSRYRNVSENSEKLFLSTMDSVKNVHDNVIEERIKKDMSTEVRKMAKKCKESLIESDADSDENIMQELDSVPMIIERRQKRRSRSKMRVENEFDTANRDCSMSDSIISVPCAAERTSFAQKEKIPAAEKRTSKSHEISRKSRSIADLEEDAQNSMILSLNGSKNMSMEVYENDEKLGKEENLPVNMEKPKRRNNRRKRNGSKEFNLTIENASLSSTAESSSLQNLASFVHEKKEIASNSTNNDNITLIEDVTPELALKDKPCSGKMKGNYSKSMLIIDPGIEKEDYSLHLDQPRPRRRRNQVKPTEADEFNVHLKDVSSNVEESISSIVDASHQLKMGHKSSVSADEILNADTDPQKISEEGARESTLTMKKESSGKAKRSFDQSSSISDDFRVEANSPVMDTVRPKRRNKQLLSGKGDTFNVHLEEVSSKAEESISLVAEASHQSQRSCKSSISVSSEIPDAADKQENSSKQKTEDDASAIDQQVNGEIKMNIDKSRLIADPNLRRTTNYPAINIAKQKRVSNEMQPLKGDEINVPQNAVSSSKRDESTQSGVTQESAVPQNAVSSSKNSESISSEAEVNHQSRVAEESAVPADILPESSLGSESSMKKNIEAAILVSTDKTSIADAKLDNTSKQETADDAPPIDKQVNDETKRNISKSRVADDEELSMGVNSPLLNVKNRRRKYQRKSVNGNEFNIAMEDFSLSNAADSISSIAENSHSEKSGKGKESESIVESEDPTRLKAVDVAPAIDQLVNDETKRNISKSRVAADEEMSLDVNSPPLNLKSRKKKNQRKSVNGNEFNIAMEGLSVSNAADSITSVAEISHSEKSAEDKTPEGPAESENPSRHKADDGTPVIGQEVSTETKGNISQSRLISDEELSMDSAVMIVGRRKRRKNEGKSLQSEAFDIAVGGASSSTVSDSISSLAEASVHSDLAPQAYVSEEEIPKASVEPKHPFGKRDECVASVIAEQVNVEATTNISRSTLILDADNTKEVKSPERTIKMQKMTNIPMQALQSDEIDVLLDDVILSKKGKSNSSEINCIHESKIAQKCSVPAVIVPECVHSSGDSVNKSSVDEASVIIGKAPTISVESGITSKHEIADDAPTIDQLVVPASKEFKKPRIPPKPKKAQVEDFDEDEDKEMNPPEKKRRLPVWARNELKTVVTEAIEEQEDCLLDPQDFLFDLVDTIKLVMKSKRLKEVRQGVQKVKEELFNLKLIRTLRDFYQFVRDYLPYEFRKRSIPSSGHYKFNPVWEVEADLDCSLFGSVERI
ncbi:hypothetical protein J437_LFUL000684 [Ladona fulva]|uniref:Uncharacterized protein n=1 Tax=Ladona fulva TaxID=123851 RepID=A0A8K0P1E2_LADFU|nr:hypothetical protein J437_LFUL000684 [Ladona fulva]